MCVCLWLRKIDWMDIKTMKMKPEHYQVILENLRSISDRVQSHRSAVVLQGKSKDVEKRVRWDLLWATTSSKWVCDELYSYGVNDNHIDTALRRAMKELGL